MVNQLRLVVRCLSPVVICAVLSGCGAVQSNQVENASMPSAAQVENSQPATTRNSPTPAIATLRTEQKIAGFSSDGTHYLHLESWRDTGAGIPNAALQLINISANACVAKGCIQTRFQETDSGLSLEAAETNVLQQTQTLRQTLKLTNPAPGVKLPLVARSRTDNGAETVTVQLPANQPLQLRLQQKQENTTTTTEGEKERAAMQLEVSYGGKQRTIGSLKQMQDWTTGFSIREVQQSPDGKSIVVLITAAKRDYEGTLDRTLVQSFEL